MIVQIIIFALFLLLLYSVNKKYISESPMFKPRETTELPIWVAGLPLKLAKLEIVEHAKGACQCFRGLPFTIPLNGHYAQTFLQLSQLYVQAQAENCSGMSAQIIYLAPGSKTRSYGSGKTDYEVALISEKNERTPYIKTTEGLEPLAVDAHFQFKPDTMRYYVNPGTRSCVLLRVSYKNSSNFLQQFIQSIIKGKA